MKTTRRTVQIGFVLLTLIGVFLVKGNAERWCPFGGVEAVYSYARDGNLLCSLGTSNLFILGGVLLGVWMLRRAFCGYMCPIGAISEWTNALAVRLGLKSFRVAGKADRALALLKYPVLALILWATWKTSELMFRGYDPCYVLLSRHGADITIWAYVIAGAVLAGSAVLMVPFCRWFCPLAAVMNPLSRFGLMRVKRDSEACHSCGKCSKVCPAAIPVDKVQQVTAARCIACLNCVDVCPRKSDGALFWGPPDVLGRRWPGAILVVVLLACTAVAVAAAYLNPLPSFVKSRGDAPAQIATISMRVMDLTCRGRANMMVGFLERDDMNQIPGPTPDAPGYYKLEAWPSPQVADVRISYDPRYATEASIKQAITEPYYDLAEDRWWTPPFIIEGQPPRTGP